MLVGKGIAMSLRVAGIQMPVTCDVAANRRHIEDAIMWASGEEADILLTPEGSLSGYTHKFDLAEVQAALLHLTSTAAQAGIGLALGTCFVEACDGKTYNQVRFYEPDGNYLGFHSKTLPTGSMSAEPVGELNHYAIRPLRSFQVGDHTVAALICNDMWANPMCTPMPDPHLTHMLAGMGVRVIFHAVNGGRSREPWSEVNWQFHSSNLRMRARASRIWIVTVDSCEPVGIRCSAPSGVVDPSGNWRCKTRDTGIDRFVYTIRD